MPKVSIVIPIYGMDNGKQLLERNLKSIYIQEFDDYEIVISDSSFDNSYEKWVEKIDLPIRYFKNEGTRGMANNTNNAINKATGELVKILFQDDYFYDSRSLEKIIQHFTPTYNWLVTGCTHTFDGINFFNNHKPYYSESENTIGSPSVVTFRNGITARFDPSFRWVLDLDFYKQLYRKHGKPKIFDQANVVIGIHLGQETNKLPDMVKRQEHQLLRLKYEQAVKL
jgi:glycosyltransferase involved in cell wall biosynthesis